MPSLGLTRFCLYIHVFCTYFLCMNVCDERVMYPLTLSALLNERHIHQLLDALLSI